ncbi:MAG: metallophosphoesterase [Solirubrobacterales bacterium]|nr:metallophosphoesterase [Solirubrobacterales bacterium]
MRTLVVSDLHLGIATHADALRRARAREVLCERLARGVDRLVLLGDTLELRHGPAREALAVARPVLAELAGALGPDAQVLLLPGNHDHPLVDAWMERRGRQGPCGPLGLEQRCTPRQASPLAEALGRVLGPARTEVAYPGVWLRDDVYATHGHYLDVHGTVPTVERLAAGIMNRLVGTDGDGARLTADDYEARLAPLYAWTHATAQRAQPGRAAAGAGGSIRVWRLLAGGGRRPVHHRAAAAAFPLVVAALNRTGLGPLRADLRGPELRRSALVAMAEVQRRLGIEAPHLVFGHTHRTGPLDGDDLGEWLGAPGTRLHNTGNWIYETHFMGAHPAGASPYWPGGAVALDAQGPPRLERLLGEVPGHELEPEPGHRPREE